MHEIEIKAAVRDREAVLAKLEALGCTFGAPVTQEDVVYAKKVGSIPEFVSNDLFLRLRTQNDGKVIFTVKHHEGRDAEDPTGVPVEYETEVGSAETIEQMLKLFGFNEAARISKTRRKCRYEKWELCLDEVEGLGTFIEAEQMASFEEAEAAQKAMIEFLLSLGISEDDMPAQRYDLALMQRAATA